MNRFLFTLLVLMCATCSAEDETVHVGVLSESTPGHIQLERPNIAISVGYFADESVLRDLAMLELGMEVRAVFVHALRPGETILRGNKLIHIRRCVDHDEECDADRRREADAEASRRAGQEVVEREQRRCFNAMRLTLRKDPRYVPGSEDEEISKELDDRRAALAGAQSKCANTLERNHQDAYYEACEQHHCGDRAAGGCHHYADDAVNAAVIKRALETCSHR